MESCKYILRKLVNRDCWGGVHTPEARVLTWVKHEPNKRAFVKEYKKLIRNEWLLKQKKTKEWHLTLNIQKKKEILHYIKQ